MRTYTCMCTYAHTNTSEKYFRKSLGALFERVDMLQKS